MQDNLISYRQFARRYNGLTDKKKSFKQKFIIQIFRTYFIISVSQEIVYLYNSYLLSMYILKLLFEIN